MTNLIKIKNIRFAALYTLCAISVFAFASTGVKAENDSVDVLPPMTQGNIGDSSVMQGSETHEALELTPDKSELIHLDEDIGSIIIGNPTHVNVMADTARTIVVVPRKPGATHFVVLGKNGQVLMQRHVLVAAPTKDYVRIKRVCSNGGKTCEETSVFYCPDTCHEIGLDNGQPIK